MVGLNKYKAYPEYKDSGVEWLGEIPKHWELSKLRYMFTFDKGLTITKENLQYDGIPCVNYGEVHSKYGFEVDPRVHPLKCVSEKYLKDNSSSLLLNGDIVFADTSEDIDGSGNFTQLISDATIFAGYHTIIARPSKRDNSRFYAYLLDCKELRTQVRHAVKGVKVFSVTQAILRNVSIWLPSENEQKYIAAFLDHETAKIDKLIEKQQQLIELLKEKRQAVISHAVTKGLNPDVPMKDSGVEWLGEVPDRWEVSRIGWLCNVGNGCTPSRENALFWQNGSYPWLNSSKVNDERVLTADQLVTPKALSECSLPKVRKGSVIMAITGEGKTRGTSALMMIDATINQHVAYITPRTTNKILPEFIHLWLQSKYQQIRTISAGWGSTKAAITCSDVKSYPIPIPPIKEQLEIIKAIEKEKNNFSNLLCICEKQIELLQERRTALISAAVTGKIDVRDWVAPEAREVEVLQEVTA
ncbi:restriction endonuclease subunit S [Yersinia enterocolitica]|nr:restriction endonuclease subunit S [Yersinia enterocolitica]